jgi:hypothetical protein
MGLDYAWQKLFGAVHGMATGDASLRERLAAAMVGMVVLNPDDFPEGDLRQRWIGIREDLTIFEPRHPGDGKIQATTAQLSDHDAHAIAEQIVDLFMEVNDLYKATRR